jgi:dTDP-glucose 4,6-dehydratase
MKWLVFGSKGYIGAQIVNEIKQLWPKDMVIEQLDHFTSISDESKIRQIYKQEQPDFVVISVGRSYLKNGANKTVDDLQNLYTLPTNLQDNLEVPFLLASVAQQYSFIKKVIYIGTGCIFQDLKGFEKDPKESDFGDFTGSCYSIVKGLTDRLFHFTSLFPKLINVRLRMPVTYDLCPRNLIYKLASYPKVIDVPNSVSVLPTLWPILLTATKNTTFTGTLHLVNPGALTHPQILDLYRQYVDPEHNYQKMSLEEQKAQLKAERSNIVLNTDQLRELAQECKLPLLDAKEAMIEALKHYAPLWSLTQKTLVHSLNEKKQIQNQTSHYYPIMITGGCGFIGSHLVEYIYKYHHTYRIINVDNLTYAGLESHVPLLIRQDSSRYQFYHADITNEEQIKTIFQKEHCKAVLHLAAESSVDVSFHQSLHFTRTNVLGTHTLLQTIEQLIKTHELEFDRFLHVSTDEVLGGLYQYEAKEEQLTDPTNPYSASKTAAEVFVNTYSRYLHVPSVMVRLNNVIGERQFLDKLIPKSVVRRLLGLPLLVHGNGQSRRHFLDVRDAVRAIDVVFHRGVQGETYHAASSGPDHSVHEIVEYIVQHVKPDVKWQNHWQIDPSVMNPNNEAWQYITNRTFQDQRYPLNGTKLNMLGFQPQIKWSTSIEKTCKWYQTHMQQVGEMVQHDPHQLMKWLAGHYFTIKT